MGGPHRAGQILLYREGEGQNFIFIIITKGRKEEELCDSPRKESRGGRFLLMGGLGGRYSTST